MCVVWDIPVPFYVTPEEALALIAEVVSWEVALEDQMVVLDDDHRMDLRVNPGSQAVHQSGEGLLGHSHLSGGGRAPSIRHLVRGVVAVSGRCF